MEESPRRRKGEAAIGINGSLPASTPARRRPTSRKKVSGTYSAYLRRRADPPPCSDRRRVHRPPRLRLRGLHRDGFGLTRDEAVTVRVRFRRDEAKYIRERLWHPSQTFEDHPHGSLTLTLRFGATVEVRRRVRGWGAAAEVVEPERLRREIAVEGRKIAERG